MQTAKPSLHFRHNNFDLDIEVLAEQRVSIIAIDNKSRIEYNARQAKLEVIGANTLIKALQRTNPDIKTTITEKLIGDEVFLEVKVFVASAFIKAVEEVIILNKVRQISEIDSLKKTIGSLSQKVNELKQSNDKTIATYYGGSPQQRTYNGNAYEALAKIKLPKGKYIITFNFLLKTHNQWIYLYFKNGESVCQNGGFYTAAGNSHFSPYTVRKVYTVANDNETVEFTTNYANSYSFTIRNAIITARLVGN